MKRLFFVAFCLLAYNRCLATDLNQRLQQLESRWAETYYSYPENQQAEAYRDLLEKTATLVKAYPQQAEPKILHAVVISTNAGVENGFSALSSIKQARDLLLAAIAVDPNAFDGSAFVNLGTLYYMVPGWPISFGDNEKAEQLLLTALKINPNGIDANYFYGDFLLTQGKASEAIKHFEIASKAPVRPEQAFADQKLQEEAKIALWNTHQRKISGAKDLFMSSFNSARAD